VNVDTGAFEAVTGQLRELAARVESLEARDAGREDTANVDLAALEIVFDAGRDAARRELGLPTVHAPGTPRPRHLRTVRGKR
jgi:hypothetical protein